MFGANPDTNPVWVDEPTATVLSNYNHAVRALFGPGADKSRIDEFIARTVTDLEGNIYELVTSEAEIRKLLDQRHRVDYIRQYRAEAA